MKGSILVPTDFSKVADCAVNHAIKCASLLKCEISLLHVVSKNAQVAAIKEKLNKIAADITSKHKITTHAIARVGNIFDDIGDVASEIGARIIIMGTHGLSGFQHLTGSHALKVITNSSVPFIVVQEKNPVEKGYENIVIPIDLSKDTKQKLSLTANMAKHFKSVVHIIHPVSKDEFYSNAIKRNLTYAKKYLSENNITFNVKTADEKGSFVKQLIKFAVSVHGDLIAIVNNHESGPVFLSGKDEQEIITNEPEIPVMCVNPKDIKVAGSVFS